MANPEPTYIEISKQNCVSIGLDPSVFPHPFIISNIELKQKQKQYEEILSAINFFTNKMLFEIDKKHFVFIVTDKNANVLGMYGDESIINFMQKIGVTIGTQFREENMGTNSINLALEQNSPIKVIGSEHYHHHLIQAACYTIPFTYSDFNNLTGSLTLFTNIENANDIYLGILSSLMDSVKRETLLQKQNEQLFLLNQITMNQTKNGIILTDNQGYIIDINHYTEELTGRKRNDLIGRPITTIESLEKHMYNTLQYEQVYENIMIEFQVGKREKVVCLLDTLPVYNRRNMLSGAYGQFRDITDMKRLEMKTIISEKFSVIGKLSADFANEIRNPLTSVSGFIHLLKETLKQDNKHTYYLNIIQNELDHIKKLVANFIVAVKPDAPMRRKTDIQKLITEAVILMEIYASSYNVTIECSMPATPIFLYIDAIQIKKVIMNLIQNSIEAMSDGGTIMVLIDEPNENGILISIQDDGYGMTTHELEQIMDPFFTTKEGKLGLGLSISYQIIESHKGSLHAFSEKEKGTTFIITLPHTIEKE